MIWLRRGCDNKMEDTNISLVLVHFEPSYESALEIEKDIRDYIASNNPRVYQLVPSYIEERIIDEGDIFESIIGEIPLDLENVLKKDKEEGNEIILRNCILLFENYL